MTRSTNLVVWTFGLLTLVVGACSGAGEGPSASRGGSVPAAQSLSETQSVSSSQPDVTHKSDPTALPMNKSKSNYDVTPLGRDAVAELAKKLSPESYRVTQTAGTERAFCGDLVDNHLEGTYTCVVCGLPLFSSNSKFDSGTGWPSFFQPFDPLHVSEHADTSLGMRRVEINCARCAGHLGHVFDDGPRPTGLRYCLNSASLRFFENSERLPPESQPLGAAQNAPTTKPKTEVAYFAGGCFWGVEHYFQLGEGVISAESGYMQGRTENPTYEQICSHSTGHAEAVKVVFDPARISFRRLLEAFFVMHDPTQLNYQGPDYGDQYRSGIFTVDAEQERAAKAYIAELAQSGRHGKRPIVTVVEAAKKFWPAEDYHQDYIAKTGRACHVTNPWTSK